MIIIIIIIVYISIKEDVICIYHKFLNTLYFHTSERIYKEVLYAQR
jgi:hypothetical protein